MNLLEDQIELKNSLAKFQHIMVMQEQANQLANQRISFIYRMVLIGFLLILVAFSGTAYVMTTQMHKGVDSLRFMNQNMDKMSQIMFRMNGSLQGMNQDMSSLAPMVSQINTMTQQMDQLNQSMLSIQLGMSQMDSQVQQVRSSMQNMNQEFYQMQGNVQKLNSDVDTLSKPMRIFNKMNPFSR
ncbi:hypothetical protein [Thiosulfativibrio zosterae]|uniref:Translation initiation factor 2 n=1 Tax=Thiosulfativibrio zosterae TaxID=2675053 RepID=A0A6F8PMK5_9GAMM|nr:hypothetical protein [Thiosulfativibrio zosterae]BBP43341.1 hypothetical protein THMIRHAT_10870 [Thiosulfativibrio zosterae]